MKNDYLERILRARVYDVAVETPLEVAPNLSARLGNLVLLKREDMQPVFSFKCRGAYNKTSVAIMGESDGPSTNPDTALAIWCKKTCPRRHNPQRHNFVRDSIFDAKDTMPRR